MSLVNRFRARLASAALVPVVASAALSLLSASCATPIANAQTGKPLKLPPLLGKDFNAYEKMLGRAKLVEKLHLDSGKKILSERRYYKYPGVVRVILTKGYSGRIENDGKYYPYVSMVEVVFDESKGKVNWEDAARFVGIDPKATRVIFQNNYSRDFEFDGKEWTWAPDTESKEPTHSIVWTVK